MEYIYIQLYRIYIKVLNEYYAHKHAYDKGLFHGTKISLLENNI